MILKIINQNFDKNQWNQKAPHPLQSWEWGEARKKMGIEILRLMDKKNVYQLTFHKIPLTKFKIGYLPRSVFPSKQILNFLFDYGKKNNLIFIKIEPYTEKSQAPNSKLQTNFKFKISNFKLIKSPHPLFPQWTQILDLTKSEDEIFKNLHPKTRYNIRLAEKKGVKVIEESNDKGFETFIKLYFETCKRQKYFGHNYNYHQIIWKNLKKEIAHILTAYYQNIPLASYQLWYKDKIIYYVYGGTSDKMRNLMASNLLMWEAIRLGKKLGAKKFDMWGSLPPCYDKNHPWAGFTRFKSGYGTKFVEMIGSYDLIINPLFYKIYNIFYLIRELYLKFKINYSSFF